MDAGRRYLMSPIFILLILILICDRWRKEAANRFYYDQRDWNILKLLVKITAVLLAAGIVFWNWVERGGGRMIDEAVGLIAVLCFSMLVPLTAYSWLRALDCFFYIKRLEKHGYFLPKRKTDYGNDLRNMPRRQGYAEKGEIQRESIILAVLAWGAAAVFFFRGFFCCITWFETYEGAEEIILNAFLGAVCNTLVWIAIGFWYYRQRLESRFRDDAEPEDGRRQRRSIIAGITILHMLFLAAFVFQDFIFSFARWKLRQ